MTLEFWFNLFSIIGLTVIGYYGIFLYGQDQGRKETTLLKKKGELLDDILITLECYPPVDPRYYKIIVENIRAKVHEYEQEPAK